MPKVSVVIPTHNYGHFLVECLASIAAQTFQDWEVFVVDDGSTDDTFEVFKAFVGVQPDPKKFSYIYQPNQWVCVSRNKGIRAARGEYIIPIDCDDTFYPTCFEKMVNILDTHPEIHIATSNVRHVGAWCDDTVMYDSIHDPRQASGDSNNVSSTSMYRKTMWEAAGGYDETLFAAEDFDFWLTCIDMNFQSMKINEWLSTSRCHQTSSCQVEEKKDPDSPRKQANIVRAKHNRALH